MLSVADVSKRHRRPVLVLSRVAERLWRKMLFGDDHLQRRRIARWRITLRGHNRRRSHSSFEWLEYCFRCVGPAHDRDRRDDRAYVRIAGGEIDIEVQSRAQGLYGNVR